MVARRHGCGEGKLTSLVLGFAQLRTTEMAWKSTEYRVLEAMAERTRNPGEGFRKCARVLRRAIQRAGQWNSLRAEAMDYGGYEDPVDPVTRRYYEALRDLVRAGFAEFRGNFDT